MSSTRLPGKMMFQLGDHPVIQHVVKRATESSVDEVIVATTNRTADDIIERYAQRIGATVIRGSESDVLGRVYNAAASRDADLVVRLTGDNTLVPPAAMDAVVKAVEDGADYASNNLEETFPLGMDAEAFSFNSFKTVMEQATADEEREHVTLYYRRYPTQFDLQNISISDVFDGEHLYERTDLRLTMDEADDYELLRRIYEGVPYGKTLDVRDAVKFVDEHGLAQINQSVTQHSPK